MKKKGLFFLFVGILFLFVVLLSLCGFNFEFVELIVMEFEVVEFLVMIISQVYGQLEDGCIVDQYQFKNVNGMVVEVIIYGGIIIFWIVLDKIDVYENVVLGYDSFF